MCGLVVLLFCGFVVWLSVKHKEEQESTTASVILHSSFNNCVSAIFHFSLFTLHFSLKERVTPILHSSFFIL